MTTKVNNWEEFNDDDKAVKSLYCLRVNILIKFYFYFTFMFLWKIWKLNANKLLSFFDAIARMHDVNVSLSYDIIV